jgi:hypothetical protein
MSHWVDHENGLKPALFFVGGRGSKNIFKNDIVITFGGEVCDGNPSPSLHFRLKS